MTAVDPARALRALALEVEPLGDGSFRVSGGAEPHVVRGRRCDCPDSTFNRAVCKHRIAAHLVRQLDPRVRAALRDAVCEEVALR